MNKNLPSDIQRSISLTYAIAACHFSWFWLLIWVLFYRRFTDFAGVGIYEALTAAIAGFGILPAGILSDRIGKRSTLFLAELISTIGAIITGFAINAFQVGIGVVILSMGGTLYVSSMEALQYTWLNRVMIDTVGVPPIAFGLGSMMVIVALAVPAIVGRISLQRELEHTSS